MTIEEINLEMSRLTQLRNSYIENSLIKQKEEFLKLEWLKDSKFFFQHNVVAYGLPEYVLQGFLPDKYKNILTIGGFKILGESKDYLNNVNIRRSYGDSIRTLEIYTSNAKLFCEFLNKYDLKIENGNNFDNHLMVFQAVKSRNG